MAFYRTETEEFQENQKKGEPISFEEICRRMEREGLL